MSGNQKKGPDVIWAWPKKNWINAEASSEQAMPAGGRDIEYIRADIHRDRIKELGDSIHKRGNQIASLKLKLRRIEKILAEKD